MEAKVRAPDPYADAPRLPDADHVDPRQLVSSDQPIELEVGPGRGGFILERLAADAHARIIGLEIRRKWATLVDRRIAARGWAQRGRVYAEDVHQAFSKFPDGSLARIYVHFPDPWWKKRHRKRLVINPEFVEAAARLLVPGGDIFVQTDVPERADAYEAVIGASSAFVPWEGEARVEDPDFGARSPRERRALEDGLPICRLRYRRA